VCEGTRWTNSIEGLVPDARTKDTGDLEFGTRLEMKNLLLLFGKHLYPSLRRDQILVIN
jgi:hypothetical protein